MKVHALMVALAPLTLVAACTEDTPKPVSEALAEPADEPELEPITDPDLVRELGPIAQRILEEHAEDPLGTEIPFQHEGRRYVARIEVHDNPEGDPGRPLGKHRGVSVYAVAR